MNKVVQLHSQGGPVFFDVEEVPYGPERVSRKGTTVVAELDKSIETTVASVRPAAQAVIDTFKALAPDEVSVEFGLRLDAEAGVVIARTGVSAHFTVSLKWSASDGPAAAVEAPAGH